MKLMMKMGFEKGRGLGKNLQGRALPIQVVKRQGKGAIGRYDNEDPNHIKSTEESEPDKSKGSSKKNAGPSAPQWRKQQREKVPKQQYVYKTLDDVLQEQTTKFQNKKTGGSTREKIIDMTGREQRILQNYDSITSKQFENEQVFSLEELTHNLDLVIESCEESMIRSHRRRKFDEDTTVALQYDLKHTQQMISDEEASMKRLHILINMIDHCEQRVNRIENISDLFFLQRVFEELKQNYPKEYQKYRLWDIAVPVLHSYIKQYLMSHWDILHGEHDHDHELIDLFSKWKEILQDDSIDLTTDSGIPSKENMDPYHRLIWDVWMPFLRNAILEWNPREPIHLIDLIERWVPYLPEWIVENILDQLIYPILQREVDEWNPLTDSIPIHSWLHPWLPLMKERLEPLYQPIRTKLAQALQNWQPSDSSARAVLLPWQKVFKQGTWDAFMNKHIVPKLVTTVQQFIIDPRQQVLDPWNWFIAWYDMVPLPSMIAILEKTFFPKWLQVLNAWLNTDPNYQEIQQWYIGWRSLLPEAIKNHTIIKEKLTEALMMIDRRISGPVNVQPQPPPPTQPPVNPNYEAIYNRGVATSTSTVVSSFKDLVEKKAVENNMLFLPIPNRTFEGKQVYRFGNANIYIDKNVLFLLENGQWIPLRLNDLVSKAI
jgi:tuftelin-interacting protein 11